MYKITEIRNLNLRRDKPVSTIIGNYLSWFKVFFFLFYLPITLFLVALAYTPQVKIFFGKIQALSMNYYSMVIANHAQVSYSSLLFEQFKLLLKDPYVLTLFLIGIILILLMNAACWAGLKHSFYPKISLTATIKEGLDKFWKITLMLVISIVLGFINNRFGHSMVPVEFGQAFAALSHWTIFAIIFMFIILFVLPLVLMPAVFIFSDEGPLWAFPVTIVKSLIKGIRIYYKNFSKYVYLFLIILVIFVIMGLAYYLGMRLCVWWVKQHIQDIMQYVFKNPENLKFIIKIALFVLWVIWGIYLYAACFLNCAMQMTLFILYPELLEGNSALQTEEQYPSLPEDFFEKTPAKPFPSNEVQQMQNISITHNTPSIKTTDGSEGLSVPSSHTNNRPFLNQKLDQAEFDRLTSKE